MTINFSKYYKQRACKLFLLFAMLYMMAALSFTACEKAPLDSQVQDMEYFYNESLRLDKVSGDSIQRFATKVETYIKQNPSQYNNPYLIEIIENIQNAAKQGGINIVITINPEWEGVIEYHF